MSSIPVSRFYKVLAITNLSIATIGIVVSLISYYFGMSKGEVTCELKDTLNIINQQNKDNEIIAKEYNNLLNTNTRDYLLRP